MTRRLARLALLAVGLLVVALVVNAFVTGRQTKPARADIGYLESIGGQLVQVREDGPRRAPAILLIHGFDGSLHWWTPSVPALARARRVIRVDLLGHGGSAKPREGYSMEDQARVLATVIERLGAGRALVAGHSMGSDVAVALAEERPDLVRGLVIVDGTASDRDIRSGLAARLAFRPVIGPAMRRLATRGAIYDAMKSAFAPGFRFPRSLTEDYRRMTFSSFRQSGLESNRYEDARPLDRRLAATRKPALVLFGDREQLALPGSENAYRDVPGAQIRLIRGAGHSPMFEKPGPTARLMLAFDRRLAAPARR